MDVKMKQTENNYVSAANLVDGKKLAMALVSNPSSYITYVGRVVAEFIDNTDGFRLLEKAMWLMGGYPASIKHHHTYATGLLRHTAEVLNISLNMLGSYRDARVKDVVLGVVWHDVGKARDYRWNGTAWEYSTHKATVGHIPRSLVEFNKALDAVDGTRERLAEVGCNIEHIEHIILSHHGRLEWHSPIEPITTEAYAVHCADMMSAHFTAEV